MPIKSKAQRRKFAELLVSGEISPETFEEWNRGAGDARLPERVHPKRAKKKATRKATRKTTAKRATTSKRTKKVSARKAPAKRRVARRTSTLSRPTRPRRKG
jgi:hypothetical protein